MSARVASAGPLSAACAEFLTHCYPKGCAKTRDPHCRRCSLWERQENPRCLRPCIQAQNSTWDLRSPGRKAPPGFQGSPCEGGEAFVQMRAEFECFPQAKCTPTGQFCQPSTEKDRLLVCMLTWPGKSKARILASAPLPQHLHFLGWGWGAVMIGPTKKE